MSYRRSALAAAALSTLLASDSFALTRTWLAATSNFFDVASAWSGGIVPTATDSAQFNAAGTYDVRFDPTSGDRTNADLAVSAGNVRFIRSSGAAARTYTAGATTVSVGTLQITDMTLAAPTQLAIDSGGRVDVNAAGFLKANTELDLGSNASSAAVSNLFINAGGTANVNALVIGYNPGKTAIVTVSGAGAVLTSETAFVGHTGTGTLAISAGGKVTSNNVRLGYNVGGVGTATLGGAGSTWTANGGLSLGDSSSSGVGTLNVGVGTRVNVGDAAASGSGSAIIVNDLDTVGFNGGELFVYNGSRLNNTSGNGALIGSGNYGLATISGAGSKWIDDGVVSVGFFAGTIGKLAVDSGGRLETTSDISFGSFNTTGSAIGTVDGTNSVLWAKRNLLLGNTLFGGVGTLTTSNDGRVLVGDSAMAFASVDLMVNDVSALGSSNGGVLSVLSGSTLNTKQYAWLGLNSNNSAIVNVKGTNSVWNSGGDIRMSISAANSALNVSDGGRVNATASGFIVGESGSGQATVSVASGGRVDTTQAFTLGYGSNTNGYVNSNDSNSAVNVGTLLEVGRAGYGEVSISNGGKVTAANAVLASQSTGIGKMTLSDAGSLLDIEGDLTVGGLGSAQLKQNAQTLIRVGDLAGTGSNIEVSDSNLDGLSGGNFIVNHSSFVDASSVVSLGNPANSYGQLAVSDNSGFTTGGAMVVGSSGTGVLEITSGSGVALTNTIAGTECYIGSNISGRGTVTIDGTTSYLDVNTDVILGNSNSTGTLLNTLTVRNNGQLAVGDMVAPLSGQPFSIAVGDSDSTRAVGGRINVYKNSTLDAANSIFLGIAQDSFGQIVVVGTNAKVKTGGVLYVGGNGNGFLSVSGGGRVEASGVSIYNGVAVVTSAASGTGGGGTIEAAMLEVGASAFFSAPAALNVIDGVVKVTNTLSISQTGTLTMTGGTIIADTLTRAAAGTFNFNAGKLATRVINGSITQTNGVLAPNNSGTAEFSSISGTYTMNGGAMEIELGATTTDQLYSDLNVVLNGGGLSLVNLAYTPLLGDDYPIVTAAAGGVSGKFKSVTGVSLSLNRSLAVYYTSSQVRMRTTLPGDANFSNTVNFDDLVALAQNYNGTNKVWSQGDFNGSGTVNFDDLVILAQHYNTSVALVAPQFGSEFAADWALAQSLVPEPIALAALSLGWMAVRRKRIG